jgi:uncharacterized protein (DUF2236 family)
MAKATDEVLGKLYKICDSYLGGHSRRFVGMMNQAKADGREEAAVESAMRYLISPRNGGSDRSKTIAYLKSVVGRRNENNVPAIERLLGKYYKP